MRYGQIKLTESKSDWDAADNMLNLLLTEPILVADVLQIDYTYFIMWWIAPIVVLFGRLAVAVYRTRRKRNELRQIEKKSTPFTRQS